LDKVLFVVDRKDLDYQTMKEYDRFEKGAANSNTSTRILTKQLEDPNARFIITTIQKLDVFVSKNNSHDIFKKHIIIIFDECHRSQFGDMHRKITKAFKNYHLFGFTGTPIFAGNAGSGGNPLLRTTEQAFGEKLHTYTIVDAINDGNVLPFRIDFIDTIKMKEGMNDKKVAAIDTERVLVAPERIQKIVSYILEHFDQKTKQQNNYLHKVISNVEEVASDHAQTLEARIEEQKDNLRVRGFNSIFAVSNSFVVDDVRISPVKLYYDEFKKQLEVKGKNLRVATVFSFAANEEEADSTISDEEFDNNKLDAGSRDFLENAIQDYNAIFGTSYDTSADKFQNYYKDISLRMKNREIDLLIVVGMFLTGFDATTLNTLWVDKNLRQHGLIQAFSRTNRILDSVKTFGNIVCFRDLKQETDDAIALFGDKDASGIVLLKTYDDYMNGYDEKGEHNPGYIELIDELKTAFPLEEAIIGEEAQKEFIRLYGAVLRLKNILTAFDDFEGNEILAEGAFQDYRSIYIDLYQELRPKTDGDKENINDDIVFELELIRQIEVNIDYILMLVEKYHISDCVDKTILVTIDKAVNSGIELRSKKELIERFIEQVNVQTKVDDDWKRFVQERKEEDLTVLIEGEKLKDEATRQLIERAFRDGTLKTTGTDIDKIMPPVSRFGGGNRAEKKQGIIEKLLVFFEKYLGLV
jgi:type I restriction enzyme R subunit